MKHRIRFALALLVIAEMTLTTSVSAETPADQELLGDNEIVGDIVEDTDVNPEELSEQSSGGLISEAPEAPGASVAPEDAVAVYRFIVDDTEYAVQQVRAGEVLSQPKTPEASGGMTFETWVQEDGEPLFKDADGDGEIDPLIAGADTLGSEICVWARFTQAQEQPEEEPGQQPGEQSGLQFEEEPGQQPGEQSGRQSGEEPGQEPGEQSGQQPGEQSGQQFGEEPGQQPGEEPGQQFGKEPGQQFGEQPGEQSGKEPGQQLGEQSEEQPGEESEQQPEKRTEEDSLIETESAEALSADGMPAPNVLVYNGEPQALVSAGEGWLFSMDGENYTADIPLATDAGDYTVYFISEKPPEVQAQTLAVTIAKADVVLIPPEILTGEE